MNKKYFSSIIFISLFCLLISQSALAKTTEESSSLAAIVAKYVAQGMDEGQDLNKLHKTLMEALQKYPNSPSLNYQLARYVLKTGALYDNSLIAYNYKSDAEENALSILNKVIEQDPSYGKAYSLLGHIYTFQNKLKDAEASFAKAIATNDSIPWLTLNQVLFHIKMKNWDKAASLLNQLTKTRPAKGKTAQNNVYHAAWNLLKKVSIKKPKYDPNETVRKGFAKRVAAENIEKYLAADKSNKLTFIHLTSNDIWCKPCIQSDKVIAKVAKKYHKDVNFIHVSFEPWESIKYHTKDLKPFAVKGLPSNTFYKQGKIIANQAGIIEQHSLERYIAKSLKTQ